MAENRKYTRRSSSASPYPRRSNRRLENRADSIQSNSITTQRRGRKRYFSYIPAAHPDRVVANVQTDSRSNSAESFIAVGATNVNVQEVDINTNESNRRDSNISIQPDPMKQSQSTGNAVSACTTTAFSDILSTSNANGRSDTKMFEEVCSIVQSSVMEYFKPLSRNLISSFERHFSLTGNVGDSARYPTASSGAKPNSMQNMGNYSLEQPFLNRYPENEGESSLTENRNDTILENHVETSPIAPICSVCWENYGKVLRNGGHFVAISCGHVVCNNCVILFMASRMCHVCGCFIDSRRNLRLLF